MGCMSFWSTRDIDRSSGGLLGPLSVQVKPGKKSKGLVAKAMQHLVYLRDWQNAGSCELYCRWNSVTCMGKRYLLPKAIPPIAMVKFATATVSRLPKEHTSSRPPETAVPVLKLY